MIAASLEVREWCQARNRLDQFAALVTDARLAPEARGWLRSELAGLRDSVQCRGASSDTGGEADVQKFVERIKSAGGIENVVDFRIPREIVAGADDDELVHEVTQRMWWGLETPYEPDERLSQVPAGQRAVYALEWTAAEVGNGGFHQYFSNSTGSLFNETLEGVEVLGGDRYIDVLNDAAAVFPRGRVPESRAEREEVLDRLTADQEEELNRIDETFFALLDHPTLNPATLSATYIRAYPAEFFVRPLPR